VKAVISTTYDDKYLFFLPITTWLWNKLGVDVICFIPFGGRDNDNGGGKRVLYLTNKMSFVRNTLYRESLICSIHTFNAPEHKEATYAQCARLYAASLDLPGNEKLIVSDIDMLFFNKELLEGTTDYFIYVIGNDLVPNGQYPMCYLIGTAGIWREAIGKGTYQEHLDNLLGNIEDQHMRGNYWGKDQETSFELVNKVPHVFRPRTNGQNPFAQNRIDRDDAYFLERLSPDTIDYHMHRPGYEDDNFQKIIQVISYFYPNEDLTWMIEYQQIYKSLM